MSVAQAGLAVAEQLGGVARPWQVAEPNGRIHCHSDLARGVPTPSQIRPLGAEAA